MEASIKIPEDVVYEVLDGEAVILNASTGTYFKLNPTGTFIWESIRKGSTKDGAVSALAKHFDLTADKAKESVGRFVTDLSAIGLLEL